MLRHCFNNPIYLKKSAIKYFKPYHIIKATQLTNVNTFSHSSKGSKEIQKKASLTTRFKCLHNGIILIVNCYVLYRQIYRDYY